MPSATPDSPDTPPALPTKAARSRSRRRGMLLVGGAITVLLAGAIGLRMAMGPTVTVVAAKKSDLTQKVVMTGRVQAPARISVGVLVAGTVSKVLVDEGDTVKEGQPLLQLDDAELRASVAQARAGLAQARAKLQQLEQVGARLSAESLTQAEVAADQASRKHERLRRLLAGKAATETEVSDALSEMETARSKVKSAAAQARASQRDGSDHRVAVAAVEQARAELDVAEARLAQAWLVAAADGLVLTREVEPGDAVQPGRALLLLSRAGDTHLEVQPDEKNLAYLSPGQGALASADAFPQKTFSARVTTVAPSVDAQRGTVMVKLAVPEPPPYLRPDMTVSVEVEVARRAGVVVLPPEAVREAGTRKAWVLRVRGGHAERQPVVIGISGDGLVEVTEGLEAGDVVVPPPSPVKPGDRVRPVAAPSSAER